MTPTANDHKAIAKEWIARPVIDTLAGYGVSAALKGRNDIVIDGRKISGLAQYIKDGYICSHCSLLFRTDLEKLERCLTVDKSKYTTKAITSVRSRVANISDHITGQDMQSFRKTFLASANQQGVSCMNFSEDESEVIAAIMRDKYLNPEWTYGREPAFTFTKRKRFPGGLLEVFLDVKGGVIREARIKGDFLSLIPVAGLEAGLEGVPHREEVLTETLKAIDVNSYLGSLGSSELLETLI